MRLIDADAVYNKAMENHRKGEIEDWEFDSIINYLDGAPTINTVEIVVRCKDCRHSKYAAWCEGYACCRTVGEYHHADFGCTAGNCEQTELQNERAAV